jgi:hypothetical protein
MWKSFFLTFIVIFAITGALIAQQQKLYIQLSPTPNHLANYGAGFLQVDASGQPFVGQVTPGTGTVLNSQALANNSMVVGAGGANVQTIGGSIGGPITTAGPITTTGAAGGATFALPSGGPYVYTYPSANQTIASLSGSETFTNKTLQSPTISNPSVTGSVGGNPVYSGIPKFTGLSAGAQVSCLGLDANNNVVILNEPCGTGGSINVAEFDFVPELGQVGTDPFDFVPEL